MYRKILNNSMQLLTNSHATFKFILGGWSKLYFLCSRVFHIRVVVKVEKPENNWKKIYMKEKKLCHRWAILAIHPLTRSFSTSWRGCFVMGGFSENPHAVCDKDHITWKVCGKKEKEVKNIGKFLLNYLLSYFTLFYY